jgi:predicted ABC-type ATPase
MGGAAVQDLIKALPDGASAVAIIMVVILFLKQQERVNAMFETITKGFNEQAGETQKTFQDQILKLTSQQFDNQKSYQDQIQSLIDAHIKVSRETILAMKALEASLKVAKDRGHIKVVS